MQAVLQVNNVFKRYGNRYAVNDISLQVNEGEVYGFIGPNGAGKTTLIRLIVGLASITSGEIEICGYSIKRNFEKAILNVGGIIENPELYPYLTGRQNLQLFAGLYSGITPKKINEVIALVGLQNRIDDRIKKYSLGMRQRVGIAQSLLHNPKILILDEPTNGLDPSGIHQMRMLLKSLAKEQGVAVFISSHILSEMQQLVDRAAIINNGKILNILTMKELQTGENLIRYQIKSNDLKRTFSILKKQFPDREITLSENNKICLNATEDDISQTVKILVEQNISIYSVIPFTDTLEEKYLHLTRNSRIT